METLESVNMSERTKKTIYTPASRGSSSSSIVGMLLELYDNRELIWSLINRDLKTRYSQTWFGYVWALLPQIVTVAVFTFLASRRVFAMGETELPYVIHAIWSISFWQFFAACIINCTQSLSGAGAMLRKINFCKEALIIASVGQCVFDFFIRLLPVIVVLAWYKFAPSLQIVYVPLIIIISILIAIGVGFITSVLNIVIRDTHSIVSIIMTFGLFLSPILYPPPVREPFVYINSINPFSPLLIATQKMIAGTFTIDVGGLFPVCALSVIVFIGGWKIFNLSISKVIERA